MRLSKRDRDGLQAASEMMLRPFEWAGLPQYLNAVAASVRPLVGAFTAVAGVLEADGTVHVTSDDYPAASIESFKRWKLADEGTQRALSLSHEVFTMSQLVGQDWDGLEQDPMMNEWYYPHGVHDVVAFFLRWPEDGAFASLEFHHGRFGTSELNVRGLAMLKLLVPSLRAGARLLYTAGAQRLRLSRDFDALDIALCVCTPSGHVAHASTAMRDILTEDSERGRIIARVGAVAREAARATGNARDAADRQAARAHDLVHTATASYRLSAARASYAMALGASDILVTVGRMTAPPLTTEDIASRFALTRREAEVAERLARGQRNAAIADGLRLSPHTVRRHTERVLAKLGVDGRAEVAARLRQ